jgi:UDP-glucose 4-epimerase
VANANLLALEKKTKSRIFNIGTGKETSVNEIFSLIKKASGTKTEAEHVDAVPGEVDKIRLDCSLAKKELGWQPMVQIEEGIKRTFEWFRNK